MLLLRSYVTLDDTQKLEGKNSPQGTMWMQTGKST